MKNPYTPAPGQGVTPAAPAASFMQDQLEKYRAEGALLPDGMYRLTVTDVESGDDHIFLYLGTDAEDRTRVRLTFSGNGQPSALEHTSGFGIAPADAPTEGSPREQLAALAQTFLGRTVDARLSHYESRDGRTFQTLVGGTIRPVR